jgi:hypothetical protein
LPLLVSVVLATTAWATQDLLLALVAPVALQAPADLPVVVEAIAQQLVLELQVPMAHRPLSWEFSVLLVAVAVELPTWP